MQGEFFLMKVLAWMIGDSNRCGSLCDGRIGSTLSGMSFVLLLMLRGGRRGLTFSL